MTAFKSFWELKYNIQVQYIYIRHGNVGRGHPPGALGAEDVLLGGAALAHHHTGASSIGGNFSGY